MLTIDAFGGGAYTNNGGRQYATASVHAISNRDLGEASRLALRRAKEAHSDITARIEGRYPRGNAAETAVLAAARELDALAAALLPECEREIEAQVREKAEKAAAANAVWTARSGLEAKVVRLLDEGLLDGSNALAQLREFALVLKAEAPRTESAPAFPRPR